MTPALAQTLVMLEQAATGATDPWWIIGSAAVVLHGATIPFVKDVDLMMSARDAGWFLERVGGEPKTSHTSLRFRSSVFGAWNRPPIPVEIFGGFSVATKGGWSDVSLSTRQAVTVLGHRVYVPSVEELARLLHSFGRPKDLERASLLRT